MGNQIVCPSGQNWFLSDFVKMGITIDHSIYDGTLLLSFKAKSQLPKREIVVKAFKIPTSADSDDKEKMKYFEQYRQETLNVINNSSAYFNQLIKMNINGIVANTPHICEEGAYIVRPYYQENLQSRMNDFPELTNYEKDWIAYQILRCVNSLHKIGFYHGDIKPENVLLTARLQALIVDPAPFKPVFLSKNQPNFFLHYFNYDGGSAFIAPERVVENQEVSETAISLSKCDLFSVGCLLAFLYLGGKTLFTFTSIQEYKNDAKQHDALLKPLDGIQDEKIRNLILTLLSVDPEERVLSDEILDNVYPKWFSDFYNFFYNQHLDTVLMEKMLMLHDNAMEMLPERLGEGSLIYFNILSDVILSSGRLVSLQMLINHYVEMTTKYFDTPMKLTRAIPPLFEIFERRVNVASIYAFDGITKIFDTIDKIPEEFSNYHTAFLLPRLANVLKDGWASVFVCGLPKWAVSMHRLWPSFYSDLRSDVSICQYLFTVNSIIISSNGTSESDIGFIRSYLKECTIASRDASYDLLSTLCFFLFPLLSTSTFLPDITNMIHVFYSNFSSAQKTMFHETLEDPLFTAIFACDVTPQTATKVLSSYKKLLSIPMKEIYRTQLANATIKLARIGSSEITTAAAEVIEELPEFYRKLFFAAIMKPPEEYHYQQAAHGLGSSMFKPPKAKKAVTMIQSIKPLDLSQQVPQQQQTKVASLVSTFHTGTKAGNFINSVFFLDNNKLLILHDDRILSTFNYSTTSRDGFELHSSYTHYNKIYCIEKVSGELFVYSDMFNIFVFDAIKGMKCSFLTSGHVIGITTVDENLIALTFADSSIIEFRRVSDFSLKDSIECSKSPIACLRKFENTPFFCCADIEGNVFVIDERTSLPILRTFLEGVYDFVPINNVHMIFAMLAKEQIIVYNCSTRQNIIVINGHHGSVTTYNDVLYIAGTNGTFYIDTKNPSTNASLFEKGQNSQLTTKVENNVTFIELPDANVRSLNSHIFHINCSDCKFGTFVTGDTHGFVNIWSSRYK